MSGTNGPVRRRRIAGESGPAAPPKPVTRRVASRKAAVAKAAAPPAPGARPATAKPLAAKPSHDDTATSAEPGRRSGPSRRDLLWLVPATLVAMAALGVGTWFLLDRPGIDDAAALDTERRQASSAAASAAETIFSFRFDQLDEHLTSSKALMTPAFAKEFDKIAPALTELAPQRKIVVQAVARESAALPCGDDCSATAAEVLVFVDQARLVGDSTTPTVFANRIKVSMVKQADGWVVSNVRAL